MTRSIDARIVRQIAASLCAIVTLSAVGCTQGDYVPVEGTVTFDGGAPPFAGILSFINIEKSGDFPARDGTASFTTSGEFEAITSTEKGLLPGKYRIEVSCNKYEPDYSKKDPFADATVVDPSYKPQEIVVEKGSPQRELKIEVPMKK
jgi:pectin methylesterase-like acyl-CoA thioesterase